MSEDEKIIDDEYSKDNFTNLDSQLESNVKKAFKTLKELKDLPSNPQLENKILRNFQIQAKIRKSLLGKLFPSLVTNERFMKRLTKIIVTVDNCNDFLHQYIPGKIEFPQLIGAAIMVLFLVGIGGVTYFLYNPNKNNSTSSVSTAKPIIRLSASPTPNSNISEKNKTNETSNLNNNIEPTNIAKETNNIKKTNKIRNNSKLNLPDQSTNTNIDNEIADNKTNKENLGIGEVSSQTRGVEVKDVDGLSEVHTIYISIFEEEKDKELRQALIDKFNSIPSKIKVLKANEIFNKKLDARMKKTSNLIQIVSEVSGKVLWQQPIENFGEGSPQEIATKVVDKFLKDIEKIK